ncbi:CvpA family protein [Dokdonia sinensis]|uniref:CvpA family protein n=1 Tax=Dokdonia sinensis TaxID=2479847 RepID=A0A3M0GNT7_9FLAO|nr:CvpA family protein [Dokdonia sinensis]RMB63333.1 CvpA family protein [Dokdonia sinensis]
MNTIDIIFGIILILGLIQGLRKGLFVELASLVGLVAGVYGAIHFSYYVGDWLFERTSWSEQAIKLSAFAITFIIIVVVVSLAGKLLTKVANFAMLGIVNKLAGAVFAVLKFAFLLSVVLMFVDAADRQIAIIGEDKKDESVLYPLVQPLAPALLPSILKKADEEGIYRNDDNDEEENPPASEN